MVELILLHGKAVDFNFNAKTSSDYVNTPNDCTAYIFACHNKNDKIIELFHTHAEECGIDLNATDKFGHTGEFHLNSKTKIEYYDRKY